MMLLSLTQSLLVFYVLFCIARMNFAGPFDLGIYGALNNWFVGGGAGELDRATWRKMVGPRRAAADRPFRDAAARLARGLAGGGRIAAAGRLRADLAVAGAAPEDVGLLPDGRSALAGPHPTASAVAPEPAFSRRQGELEVGPGCVPAITCTYRRYAGAEALGHAYFLAAQASMHTARGEHAQAVADSDRILTLCRKYDINAGVLVVTARHCQALDQLRRLEMEKAEKTWRELLQIQKTAHDLLFQSRTLNYLGLTAEMRKDDREAETLYREALALQEKNPQTLPGTQFISLWRLAGILDRGGITRRAGVCCSRRRTGRSDSPACLWRCSTANRFLRSVRRCLRGVSRSLYS